MMMVYDTCDVVHDGIETTFSFLRKTKKACFSVHAERAARVFCLCRIHMMMMMMASTLKKSSSRTLQSVHCNAKSRRPHTLTPRTCPVVMKTADIRSHTRSRDNEYTHKHTHTHKHMSVSSAGIGKDIRGMCIYGACVYDGTQHGTMLFHAHTQRSCNVAF